MGKEHRTVIPPIGALRSAVVIVVIGIVVIGTGAQSHRQAVGMGIVGHKIAEMVGGDICD